MRIMGRLTVVFCAIIVFLFTTTVYGDENSLTFDWYDGVAPEKLVISDNDKVTRYIENLGERTKLYRKLNGAHTLGATNFSSEYPNSIAWVKTSGLVDTLFFAYKQHHNVIIRPDDIWTAILTQFSMYVNGNAEALRTNFVNFEDKKPLIVVFTAPVNKVDIREYIRQVDALIRENIDQRVYDWITPNFTTTTSNDKLTAGVIMMSTLKVYFDYEFWSVVCGIPKGTILGTVDDWMEIRKRVEKFREFDLPDKNVMAQWTSMLIRILDEFVSVKKGNQPNSVFWKEAVRVDYKMVSVVCSMINTTILNGWVTTFSAFDQKGKWRGDKENVDMELFEKSLPWLKMEAKTMTPGLVHAPIKFYDEFAEINERNYTGALISGQMGYSVQDETTIQPISGWIMTITDKVPAYILNKN